MKYTKQLQDQLNEALKETLPQAGYTYVGAHPVHESEEGNFNPKLHGLYRAEKSHETMTPGEVQKRAETYIHQYQKSGYKISDVSKNADGSW